MRNSVWRILCAWGVCLLSLAASNADAGPVKLAWDPSPDPNVTGYNVLYGPAPGSYSARVNVGLLNQYTLDLSDGLYYFAVEAYDDTGLVSVPSNEVTATVLTPILLPPPPPPPSSSCTTPDPFATMGGGTCYNGGWLPPGMPIPGGGTVPPAPAPTPAPSPAPSPAPGPTASSSCATPDPFATMGGGTCYNGGWLPPGMPIPGGGTASPSPAPTPAPSPAPSPAPAPAPSPSPAPQPAPAPSSPASCATPDPFATMGGGTCYSGGWLPPGMPIPGGGTASPAPAPPPTPQPSNPTECSGADPFIAIAGVVGHCINGGWVPVEGIRGTGTVHQAADGQWIIEGDDQETYAPLDPLDALLQVEGLRVSFAGVAHASQAGTTVLEVFTISTL